MSMLRFSAEAALYKASGHYRTRRHAPILPIQTNSAIYPAMEPGEVVVIRDCLPGWEKLGEGVCVRVPSLPGGGGPPGTPDEPGAEPPPPPGGGPGGEPAGKDKPSWAEKRAGPGERSARKRKKDNPLQRRNKL